MFELTVALKYLIPRWRQLSVSIISLISIVVISLVVWLILVFFSVSDGLHQSWTQKIIALTAPVRMTPTDEYYDSYYYRIDSIAAASDYQTKSIREKMGVPADPYDSEFDEEVPISWPPADRDEEGRLKSLVDLALASAKEIPGVSAAPYENSMGNLRLKLIREGRGETTEQVLHQAVYFGSLEPENRSLMHTILPVEAKDFENLLSMAEISPANVLEERIAALGEVAGPDYRKKLEQLFQAYTITQLKTERAWRIPLNLYPKEGKVPVLAIVKNGKVMQAHANPDYAFEKQIRTEYTHYPVQIVKGDLVFSDSPKLLEYDMSTAPLFIAAGTSMKAHLDPQSIRYADSKSLLQFDVELASGSATFKGRIPLISLAIDGIEKLPCKTPCAVHTADGKIVLPELNGMRGVLLPKIFRENGVLVGDRGMIAYYTPTTSTLQEQRAPIYIAGFYDQGVISIGGKFVWAEPEVVAMLSSAQNARAGDEVAGINVRFDDPSRANLVKEQIAQNLQAKGIGRYFKVESYKEYPFTRDLLQQIDSETTLFTLLSLVIILVACSNIVSMLIILVNDKKAEIGILRSMGASSFSIAAIFGFCGMVMGLIGSVVGIGLALLTLQNLGLLVEWISRAQGHALFNSRFFGDMIPNALSGDALAFVLIATIVISVISGIVPAMKAALMSPAEILKAD